MTQGTLLLRKAGWTEKQIISCHLRKFYLEAKQILSCLRGNESERKKVQEDVWGCKMLIEKCLLSGQKVSQQHSVGPSCCPTDSRPLPTDAVLAIAWDLKEKSYLQACEKIGGGTHSSYELVIQSGS